MLTDTPILKQLKENFNSKNKSKVDKVKRKLTNNTPLKIKNKKSKDITPDDTDDDMESVKFIDSEDDVDYDPSEQEPNNLDLDLEDIQEGSFILVQFPGKKTNKHFVGKVLSIDSFGEFHVTFLRKRGLNFVFPIIKDDSVVEKSNIIIHLPTPLQSGGTARTQDLYHFDIDLSSFNLG